MGINYWTFASWVWIVLTIMGSMLEFSFGSLDEQTSLNTVIQLKVFNMREFDVLFFDFSAPVPNLDFFDSLTTLLTWNFSFFEGNLNIVRWIIWLPLTAGMSYVVITVIGPAMMNVIAQARSLLRI